MVTWLARYRALKAGDLIMATPIEIQAHMTKARNMGLENSRVPNEYCTSTEYYKGEQQMIFRRAWLMIGRVKVVENVGDYIVRDMPMLEANVIITHGEDGKIRALHNACSYLGVALVLRGAGQCADLSPVSIEDGSPASNNRPSRRDRCARQCPSRGLPICP